MLLLLAALAPAAFAAAPPETLVLHADRLLDVRSGRIVNDALVVIAGDRITAAGPSAQVTVPAGARRI
ncbi:MAG TPA: amidohydrolase family protein, partial [Thermoanaerobaculia bacterium]